MTWLRRHAVVLAAWCVAIGPFVVAVARGTRAPKRAAGDLALVELAMRAVGSRAVLVGPYSRFGWHHPGPAYFYLGAIPFRLLGGDGAALHMVAPLFAMAGIAAVLVLVGRRHGPLATLWAAVVIAMLAVALGEAATSPWTPYVPIFPALAACVAAWAACTGERWALPVAVGFGTFAVQTHVGFGPLVATACVGMLVGVVVEMVRRGVRRWIAPALVALALLAVLWAPPLVDVLVHHPSNVGLLRAFRVHTPVGPGYERHTTREGFRVATRLAGGVLGIARGADATTSRPGPATWATGLAFVGALAWATWRRRWSVVVLGVFTVGFWAAAVVAVRSVVGPVYDYLVLWIGVVGAVAWLTVGLALTPELRGRLRRGAIVTLVLVGGVAASVVATRPLPAVPEGSGTVSFRRIDALVGSTESQVSRDRRVIVTPVNDGDWPYATALVAALRHDGYEVRAVERPGSMAVLFSPWDLAVPGTHDAQVDVAVEGRSIAIGP